MKIKILITILYFCVTNVSSSPMDKKSRAQKLSSHQNSLYIRDVMRLAKAADIRSYMNEAIDPCDDFYDFACGNWKKSNPTLLFSGRAETSYFDQLVKAIKRKKLTLLQSNSTVDATETSVEKKVKDFYNSCFKAQGVKLNAYRSTVLKLIAEFGTMPALDSKSFNETQFDWLSTVAQINSAYFIPIILGSTVSPDQENNTVNRLYIGQAPLQFDVKSMYLDKQHKSHLDAYENLIARELEEVLGLPQPKARQTANEILNFEIELAKGLPEKKADASKREMFLATTVEKMQQKYAPEIDVKKYVLIHFGKIIEGPIYEVEESYQKNLVRLIKTTSKTTLANYIFYKLVSAALLYSNTDGAEHMKFCFTYTEAFFGEVLENMIYRRSDFRNIERDIEQMFAEIKNVFIEKFNSNELYWINRNTRESAITKLEALRFEITSYMQTNFTKEFAEFEINDTNLVENVLNFYRNRAKNTKAELYNPKPKKLPGKSFTPVNSMNDNTIKVPVALLQPNYFWAQAYPQAIKFGTIGFLMGHEFVHGFSGLGIKYDEFGNKRDWWDESSIVALQNRVECIKEQYHKYRFEGTLLELAEDQSENVADNAGMRLAFEAYSAWHAEAERKGDDLSLETLPNLKYNEKQLFFISFAQTWCNELDIFHYVMKMATDEHTIAKFRVIGTLSNTEDFSKAFNCSVNSRMNPKHKCVIY